MRSCNARTGNEMWILVMLVLSVSGMEAGNLYYNDEIVCRLAAKEFEGHTSKDFKLKAFCIKGE